MKSLNGQTGTASKSGSPVARITFRDSREQTMITDPRGGPPRQGRTSHQLLATLSDFEGTEGKAVAETAMAMWRKEKRCDPILLEVTLDDGTELGLVSLYGASGPTIISVLKITPKA